jgi:hypothetical protein
MWGLKELAARGGGPMGSGGGGEVARSSSCRVGDQRREWSCWAVGADPGPATPWPSGSLRAAGCRLPSSPPPPVRSSQRHRALLRLCHDGAAQGVLPRQPPRVSQGGGGRYYGSGDILPSLWFPLLPALPCCSRDWSVCLAAGGRLRLRSCRQWLISNRVSLGSTHTSRFHHLKAPAQCPNVCRCIVGHLMNDDVHFFWLVLDCGCNSACFEMYAAHSLIVSLWLQLCLLTCFY